MTKSFLAIVLLVASYAPSFSQTAGTDSSALLTLTEAKIDQALSPQRLQKAQYIPKLGAQYLYISPFSSQGLTAKERKIYGDFPEMGCLRLEIQAPRRSVLHAVACPVLYSIYSIFVLDLKIVKWAPVDHHTDEMLPSKVEVSS